MSSLMMSKSNSAFALSVSLRKEYVSKKKFKKNFKMYAGVLYQKDVQKMIRFAS